jgi:PEP-CTERM motif
MPDKFIFLANHWKKYVAQRLLKLAVGNMKMKINIASKIVIAVGICLTTATVFADQTIIVPEEFTLAEANTSDNAPLGAISDQQHFQQVFSASLLSGMSIGDLITGIGFRVEGNESALPAQIVTSYDISLGQSANAPGNLSTTFADNRGADFTTVRSGPLTINANGFTGGSSPNDMGWISFSTPFQYEGGDLLVEVAYEGFSLGRDADAAYPYDSSLAQTSFGSGYNSTTADEGLYSEAIVTGFSISPDVTPVPEPAAPALLGVGALLFVVRRKWRN